MNRNITNDDWLSFGYINGHVGVMRNHLRLLSDSSKTKRHKKKIQKAQKLLNVFKKTIKEAEVINEHIR